MLINKTLEELGYPANEILVYLTLLKGGEGTVTEVAKRANLPRTTTHLVIGALQEKGLVTCYIKRQHHIWFAENPNNFLIQLQNKEDIVKKLMPDLLAIQHEEKTKPKIRYYEGVSSVKQVLDQIATSKFSINILGSFSSMAKYLGGETTQDFLQKLLLSNTPVSIIADLKFYNKHFKKNQPNAKKQFFHCSDEAIPDLMFCAYEHNIVVILFSASGSVGLIFSHNALDSFSQLLFKSVIKTSDNF